MKATLLSLFIALLMVGCGEEEVVNNKTAEEGPSCEACADCLVSESETPSKVTEISNEAQEKAPTNVPKREVLIHELEKREGAWYAKGEAEPFTGTEVGYYEDGSKSWEVPLVDGKTQGTRIEYYKDGQKKREIPWVDGKRHGLQTSWYENGQKKAEEKYKDGKKDGLATEWHKNGQKRLEANHKDGKLMSAVGWKPNGEKCPVTNLKDGTGVVVWYREDGTVSRRDSWKNGKLDGISIYYKKDGTEWYRTTYKDGVEVED